MKKEIQRYSSESIKGRLKKIESSGSYSEMVSESLASSVFGQKEACDVVGNMVTIYEAGLSDPNRPTGILMFLGPTGTGKTEMGKAIAMHLFGSEWKKYFKKINSSDFFDQHTVARFLGSPPGYVGYADETLFDNDFLEHRNVIIFDEIEKADPALWKLLLDIFESGTLGARTSVGNDNTVEEDLDFTRSLIILTSNVGARQMQECQKSSLGFLGREKTVDVKDAAMSGLKSHFSEIPEFLGRIDEFVVFKPLEKDTYLKIYWKFVQEISDLAENVGVCFTTTNELADYLIEKAVDNGEYGARDMRHVLHRELILPLSNMLTSNNGIKGLVADIEEGNVVFYDLSSEISSETVWDKNKALNNKEKDIDEAVQIVEYRMLMEIQAVEDGYGWMLKDEDLGKVMTKMLYISNYEKWKRLVTRIKDGGASEKTKAVRVFGDAIKMMEDKTLRERFPEEWTVFKSILESFGVKVG